MPKEPSLCLVVDAVKRAVDEMPEDFAIREFLIVNRRNHYAKHNSGWFRRLAADEGGGHYLLCEEEVEGMLDTEFNEEEVWQMFQNDVDAERKRADEAETRADEAEAERDKAKSERDAAETRADEAEAERDKAKTERDEAKQQLKEALAELERLKTAQ